MTVSKKSRHQVLQTDSLVRLTSLLVGVHGLFILASTLLDQFAQRHGPFYSDITIDLPLLIGVSLVYLSSLLMRRKQTAWVAGLVVYVFFLGYNATPVIGAIQSHRLDADNLVRGVVLPFIMLTLLLVGRKLYVVRSDIQAFRSAVKVAIIILLTALAYGITGFMLMDKHDFHHEINFGEALHRTIDQFDLTTSDPLQPRDRRAHLFVDSLSFVSIASVGYVLLSLFQPLRLRLGDQSAGRQIMSGLLAQYGGRSEDFFKLWPHDKQFYFNPAQNAGVAFRVSRGVALCMGDPVGDKAALGSMLKSFEMMCYYNDWLPAFIHVEDTCKQLYQKHGYSLQKIGEEAVVDVKHFQTVVVEGKYFRNIKNRFERNGYNTELLQPPHHEAIIGRLREISDSWLDRPGRTERQFVMGNFNDQYLQQCPLFVARDAAGTIQAFLNHVPATFDTQEATFDMLRTSERALGNTNDFLLVGFIDTMGRLGYSRVNLGLAPLVGLSEPQEQQTIIDNFLQFAYANGDRFYSFSGLHRFKAKYQPEWRTRYIVYRGGIAGFTRTLSALMRAMQVKKAKP